jgi:LysM repeat protein
MVIKRSLKNTAVLLAIILLIASLTACTLKGSTGIPSEEPGGEFPVPEDENMGDLDAYATQTAAAIPPASVPTSVVANTATPLPVAMPTATVAPPPLPVATEGNPPATYVIQKGEFPFCIARRFNVNQSELLALNGLNVNSKVSVGATLKIPQTGNHFVSERSLKSHPATYTVVSGDTIYTIACKFGDVGPDMIALANNLSSPYTVTVGQTLQIP